MVANWALKLTTDVWVTASGPLIPCLQFNGVRLRKITREVQEETCGFVVPTSKSI
jgi:hypothetical protein